MEGIYMKNIITLLALLAFGFSVNSFARSIHPATHVLIEKKTEGGYVPPEFQGWEKGVVVTMNGDVFGYYRKNLRQYRKYENLGQLSSGALALIRSSLDQLPAVENIKFPDTPPCTDVPSTSYKARAHYQMTFALSQQCQEGYLESFNDGFKLKSILDGYSTLHSMFIKNYPM